MVDVSEKTATAREAVARGRITMSRTAVRLIRAGALESPTIPLDETLETLRWMDRIRAQVGVRYPFEAALEPA